MTSTPSLSTEVCSLYGTPPYIARAFNRLPETDSKSPQTCLAKSLVGHITKTRGARPRRALNSVSSASFSMTGKAKAKVLPVPVRARARTSLPSKMASNVAAWISNKERMPRASRFSTVLDEIRKLERRRWSGICSSCSCSSCSPATSSSSTLRFLGCWDSSSCLRSFLDSSSCFSSLPTCSSLY